MVIACVVVGIAFVYILNFLGTLLLGASVNKTNLRCFPFTKWELYGILPGRDFSYWRMVARLADEDTDSSPSFNDFILNIPCFPPKRCPP